MKNANIPKTMTPPEAMIHAADTAVAGAGDGRISKDDADVLIDHYHKNPDESTMHALKHVRNNYKWTKSAVEHLANIVPSFSILPIPAPDVFETGRNFVGITSKDEEIHIFFRSAGTQFIYHRVWNPFTGKNTVHQISTENGKDISTSWGIAVEVLEDYIYIAYKGVTIDGHSDNFNIYVGQIKDGVYKQESISDKTGWKTSRGPATTLFGQTVYLTWVDKDTDHICLGSFDTNEGDYTLLLDTVGFSGHEKTNYTPAIYPVFINEEDGNGNLQLRQKIMVVWLSSEQSNQFCCTFYDTAASSPGKPVLSPIQVIGVGAASSQLTIALMDDGKTVRVMGAYQQNLNNNKFLVCADYVINQQSPGGNWKGDKDSVYITPNIPYWSPSFLEFGEDKYIFYIEKPSNLITYIQVK